MREKTKPLKISNPTSRRIIDELIKRNGNDKLFDICKFLKIHQGTFRRRLEAKDRSWVVAEDLYNVSRYLNVDYEWLLNGNRKKNKPKEEMNTWIKRAIKAEYKIKQLEKINSKLNEAMFLLKEFKKNN